MKKQIVLSRWLTLLFIGVTAVIVSMMLLFSVPRAATGKSNVPDGTLQAITVPVTTTTPSATSMLTEAVYLPAVLKPLQPTATPTSAGCLPDPPLNATADELEVETAVTNQINQERSNNTQSAYPLNDKLTQAARRHANDMAQNDATSHTGSDGSSSSQRINEACYNAAATGEIIGWGFPTVEAMMEWWMNSDAHRSLILHATLEEIGVAYVNTPGSSFTHYWTVTFGRKEASSSSTNIAQYRCVERIQEENKGISVSWVQPHPCK